MQYGKKIFVAAVVLVAASFASQADAQQYVGNGAPALFVNQYSQGASNQATAQMYVAPVPVPTWVGYTYYTYQPFYPHELLYKHTDRYHSYYDGGVGLNRTRVRYSRSPLSTLRGGFLKTFSLPRP